MWDKSKNNGSVILRPFFSHFLHSTIPLAGSDRFRGCSSGLFLEYKHHRAQGKITVLVLVMVIVVVVVVGGCCCRWLILSVIAIGVVAVVVVVDFFVGNS